MEASAKDSGDEWIARRFAERARELRDGRGSTKAFVLDTRFLVTYIAHAIKVEAEKSGAGKKIAEALEQTKAFGNVVRERLPLIGGKSPQNQAGTN